MKAKDFVMATIKEMDYKSFETLKEKLIGEYITFTFVDETAINVEIFAEKMNDYFEKLELKTGDRFEKLCHKYSGAWEEVVKRYMPKEPTAQKGKPAPPMPRSLKYYKHAIELKNSRNMTMRQMADYSRIMMSLYMDRINAPRSEVKEYTFPMEHLELDKIVSALKVEKISTLPIGKKKTLFDLDDLYCPDTATFIITMIMFYYIKSREIKGDN